MIETIDDYLKIKDTLTPVAVPGCRKQQIAIPCANTLVVRRDLVQANTYNPNSVSDDRMELLRQSIIDNGFAFPVVTIFDPDLEKFVIIDGFRRYWISGPEWLGMDYVPIVVLDHDISQRMTATWQFNKARGVHQVDLDAGAPFDSFLTLRGLRTLHARMRAHAENAQRIADLLTRHPAVARVYYPGLAAHPGHDIARRQQRGFGAMVSFDLVGGVENVKALLDSMELFSLAESLGCVESLVAHPASMTHAAMDAAARERAGISATLVRLSIGIEDGDDLARDLTAGLEAAGRV